MEFILETLEKIDEIDQSSNLLGAKSTDPIPDRKEVIAVVKDVQALLFPRYFKSSVSSDRETLMYTVYRRIKNQIEMACAFARKSCFLDPEEAAEQFITGLPAIKELLIKDIEALYEGDPAAMSRDEVLICYPGFYAISIYRMANLLYKMNVPLLPRMMTEYAHEKTGIDIHAGATIGEYFFIDHGTGIVVGETTIIGKHVKLYQGVTLGAKSFELDAEGNPVKGIKRHPEIGDNTIIYANATILGGQTVIGKNCIIGGNTWLVSSVPDGSMVYHKNEN